MKKSKKDLKISYDKDSAVLSIEVKKAKSVDSDVSDNVVIDYDKKGEIVRVNLYSFDFNAFKSNERALKEFASCRNTAVLAK